MGERYDEIANEMRNMLAKVGWKKDFIESGVPYMAISGWQGDNLLKKSDKMTWWKGQEIKGVGDVLAGRVEQGIVKPNEEVVFLPTHTSANPCVGKVFTVEMHHKRVDQAQPGDNIGMNVKNLDKQNMPHGGDVMIYKKDTSLAPVKSFNAQIQVLDIPNEIKTGYSPIGFVRCGRAACRVTGLKWKMGKETGGKKMEEPHSLKSNEMAQCSFQPQQPLVCDTFKNCEGLSRVAFMDGNGVVMLGKVITCERKEDGGAGGKKKRAHTNF